MWLFSLMAAFALEPFEKPLVLHRSDDRPVSVLARMVGLLGNEADDFELRPVAQWVWSLEASYDGGSVSKCEGDLLPAEHFESLLAEVVRASQFFEPEKAQAAAKRFDGDLRCAGEVIPRATLGRAFFLYGVVEANQGNEEAARAAFRTARSMDRQMYWDQQIAQGSRLWFEDAAPGTDAAWLRIAPLPERVWVDGELVSYGDRGVHLGLGRHVVSADIEGVAAVDVMVEKDGLLLLPGLLNDGVIAQLANPERQRIIRRFVKISGRETVYFTNVDQVWRVRDGDVAAMVPTEQPTPAPKKLRRRGAFTPVGLGLGGVGLGAAGVGAVVMATSEKNKTPGLVLLGVGAALVVGGGTVIAVDQLVDGGFQLRVGGRL